MRLHFSDLAVSRLKETGEYFDTTTPAFGLRVGKHRKTWFVIRGKKRIKSKVGFYPQMALADARKGAKTLLAEDTTDTAPKRFEDAYEGLKAHIADLKPRTQRDYKRILDKYYLPPFKSKKLADITYEMIERELKALPKYEKAHALAVGRTFFRWCVRPPRRYIPHSPLEGVQVIGGRKRKRVLTPEELRIVWNAAKAQGYPHGTLVMLLILLGQRRTETASLRWPWINEKERTITLPETVTKNSKEHCFAYGQMARDIFDTIPRRNSTDLLFPSRVSDERPISGWSKFKKEMLEGIEIAQFGLHDLRRTFRTVHGQIGTPSEVGERIINHASAVASDVELIYNRHTYIPQMRKALEAYEQHLATILRAA